MGPPRPVPSPERPATGKLRTDSTYDWREVGGNVTRPALVRWFDPVHRAIFVVRSHTSSLLAHHISLQLGLSGSAARKATDRSSKIGRLTTRAGESAKTLQSGQILRRSIRRRVDDGGGQGGQDSRKRTKSLRPPAGQALALASSEW